MPRKNKAGREVLRPDQFKILQLACFLFFFVFCILSINSQETITSERAVTSIEVIGLKRTKPYIAEYPLEQFLGRNRLDINEVKAAVMGTGILEPREIELVESGEDVILRVTVEEKWSIIPMPVGSFSSDELTVGLFLADTNAFGLADQAAIGGMYGPSMWMAMVMYNHTPNRKGRFGWNGAFMYGRQEQEDTDKNEILYRRYTSDRIRSSLGLYYPFTKYLIVSGSLSFTGVSLKESGSSFNQPENDAMALGFSPSIRLRHGSWDGYFLSNRGLSLEYTYNYALSGSSFHEAEFQGIFEQSIVPGFRFIFRNGAIWKAESLGDLPNPVFEEEPRKAQVDILPRSFSAMYYAGFSAGLEKYLFKFRWGTLSVLGSWQCVFSHGPISGTEFDHGPSGGIRLYLSRIAIPALGAGIAYNVETGLYQVVFSLGMSF